jgi:Cu-Zn family superoxide dismutase
MRKAGFILLAATIGLAACGDREGTTNTLGANDAAANQMAANDMMSGSMSAGSMAATSNMGNAAAAGTGASATLQTAQGAAAGTVSIAQADGALRVSVKAEGLPPGDHGVHIHMTGKCDAPTFETAGGHWNPTNARHGLDNPQGQHSGDMPNLTIGSDGRGTLDYTLKAGTLAGLLDTDGAAFVVHAAKDDQKTDPSGASGGRIACGVFNAG